MSKTWTFIGSNAPMPKTEEEERAYKRKQFKWGLRLEKMPYNKPKVNFKKDTPIDEEE